MLAKFPQRPAEVFSVQMVHHAVPKAAAMMMQNASRIIQRRSSFGVCGRRIGGLISYHVPLMKIMDTKAKYVEYRILIRRIT
jgi:hypothetical protein